MASNLQQLSSDEDGDDFGTPSSSPSRRGSSPRPMPRTKSPNRAPPVPAPRTQTSDNRLALSDTGMRRPTFDSKDNILPQGREMEWKNQEIASNRSGGIGQRNELTSDEEDLQSHVDNRNRYVERTASPQRGDRDCEEKNHLRNSNQMYAPRRRQKDTPHEHMESDCDSLDNDRSESRSSFTNRNTRYEQHSSDEDVHGNTQRLQDSNRRLDDRTRTMKQEVASFEKREHLDNEDANYNIQRHRQKVQDTSEGKNGYSTRDGFDDNASSRKLFSDNINRSNKDSNYSLRTTPAEQADNILTTNSEEMPGQRFNQRKSLRHLNIGTSSDHQQFSNHRADEDYSVGDRFPSLNHGYNKDDSPPRNSRRSAYEDDSPSRKNIGRSNKDDSPPRESKQSAYEDDSPSRDHRRRAYEDDSPSRKNIGKSNKDDSPPRESKQSAYEDDSSSRDHRRRAYEDDSPSRKNIGKSYKDDSPPRDSSRRAYEDNSPSGENIIKPSKDDYPPRDSRRDYDDDSPSRKSIGKSYKDDSPPRDSRRANEDDSPSRENTVKPYKDDDYPPRDSRRKAYEDDVPSRKNTGKSCKDDYPPQESRRMGYDDNSPSRDSRRRAYEDDSTSRRNIGKSYKGDSPPRENRRKGYEDDFSHRVNIRKPYKDDSPPRDSRRRAYKDNSPTRDSSGKAYKDNPPTRESGRNAYKDDSALRENIGMSSKDNSPSRDNRRKVYKDDSSTRENQERKGSRISSKVEGFSDDSPERMPDHKFQKNREQRRHSYMSIDDETGDYGNHKTGKSHVPSNMRGNDYETAEDAQYTNRREKIKKKTSKGDLESQFGGMELDDEAPYKSSSMQHRHSDVHGREYHHDRTQYRGHVPSDDQHRQTKPRKNYSTDDDGYSSGSRHSNREASYRQGNRKFTASNLIAILAKERDYRASVSKLMKQRGLSQREIDNVVDTCPNVFDESDGSISLRPKVKICRRHLSSGCRDKYNCADLHVCPKFITFNNCNDRNCELGHKLDSRHNRFVMDAYKLGEMDVSQMLDVLSLSIAPPKPSHQLKICGYHTSLNCHYQDCNRLHLCPSVISSSGSCTNQRCQLNHVLLTKQNCRVLQGYQIDTNESPRDVLKIMKENFPALFRPQKANTGNDSRNSDHQLDQNWKSVESSGRPKNHNQTPTNGAQKAPDARGGASASGKFEDFQGLSSQMGNSYNGNGRTVWASQYEGNTEISEICYYSVNGTCRNENQGCRRLHAQDHFHWQVKERGKGWVNLRKPQVDALEKAFIDPAQDGTKIPPCDRRNSPTGIANLLGVDIWEAHFTAMILANPKTRVRLDLRRICSENVTGSVKASRHVWYFLDQNNAWVQYGNTDTTKRDFLVSNITTDDIENHYLKTPLVPLTFKNSMFQYLLDFKSMTQTNAQTNVKRNVKRRPVPHLMKSGQQKSWLPSLPNLFSRS